MNKVRRASICFDLRSLQIGHEHRGIGKHIHSILQHLPDEGAGFKVYYYHFDDKDPLKDLESGIPKGIHITTPRRKTAIKKPADALDVFRLGTHTFPELSNYDIDVFVQFDFALGLPKKNDMKTIVVGYDLIPLIFKNHYMPSALHSLHHTRGKRSKIKAVLRSMYYQLKYHRDYKNFERADIIMAISQATKDSFVTLLGIDKAKIIVNPLAPVKSSAVIQATMPRTMTNINKPYLFYIGGTDARKNVVDIVKMFHVIRSRGYDVALALAGNELRELKLIPSIPTRNAIMKSPYKNDIHLLGFVTDEQKYALYEHALAFVLTSTYEGFGIPIIEAMDASCPVVCYDNSSLSEVGKGACLMVPNYEYVQAGEAIIRLINSAGLRKKYVSLGKKRSKQFSWHNHIDVLLSIVDHLTAQDKQD